MLKNGEIIWNQDIKKNKVETDNGFVIEKILKNNKEIYNIYQNEENNFQSLVNNFSDYNTKNEIILVFIKKYIKGSIGHQIRNDIEIEVYIKSNYFYDKDLNIIKDLNSEIEAIYVKKGFEGINLYSVF